MKKRHASGQGLAVSPVGGKGRRKRTAGSGRPKARVAPLGYTLKFRPPAIFQSEDQYLVPMVHTNKAKLRSLGRALNVGGRFYIKIVDRRPQRILGCHMVLAKLKRIEPVSP